MFVLIIDGKPIKEDEYVQPLVVELDYRAAYEGFNEAIIKRSEASGD
jgi:hypothetical protein